MNLLMVSRSFYPTVEAGGTIWKTLSIGRSLVKKGNPTTVYTSNMLNTKKKMFDKTTISNVEDIRVVYFNSWYNYRWNAITPQVISYCNKELENFDIIHVYGYRDFLSTVVCHYANKMEIPYVLEPMGMFIPIVRSYIKKNAYDYLLGKRLSHGAQKIIVTSELEKKELLSRGINDDKMFLRRNGIELSEFEDLPERGTFRKKFGISATAPLILYLGTITPKKGIELLIQAFSKLKIPQLKLAIVGPNERDGYQQKLLHLRQKLRLENDITFTGPLFGIEKLQAFVDADVFTLLSQSENFGNTIAESIACKTPVIITANCGIAPYIHDRVGLVVKYELKEVKDAINLLLTNRKLWEKFIKNTAFVKEEFSWDEPINQLENLYSEIIKKTS